MGNKEKWYNPGALLSHNAFINICLSARGMGKTYATKKFIIKRFLKTGKQSVYLRRTDTELQKAKPTFFDKLVLNNEFPDATFEIKGDIGYINDKPAIFFIPLSTASSNRSVDYPNVDIIFFDEYIIESSTYTRYLKNEMNLLLSLCETIFRDREDVRVLMMANSISYVNPLFDMFNLKPKEGKRFNKFEDGLICVEVYENEIFTRDKKKTQLARLMANTSYGEYAINNKLLEDNDEYILTKPSGDWRFVSSFMSEGFECGVWVENNTRLYYASRKIDPSTSHKFALTIEDAKEGYLQVSEYRRATWRVKEVKKAFNNGNLYYSDQNVKKFMQNKVMRWI